ncbi:MAG: hypothetical protein ACRC75_09135, partial [Olsenella sp.]
ASSIDVLVINKANYRAYATGAAMTQGPANAIGAAVSVGVNGNEAIATISGVARTVEIPAGSSDWETPVNNAGGVTVSSTFTQNMDGRFAGLLGAQSIAGAASGAGSTATVAGAFAVLVSRSTTTAQVTTGSTITAGDVVVKAYDKSKLAVRAGAISKSDGGSVGVGASIAFVYGHDKVYALVGDDVVITAKSFDGSAEKAMVTFTDYGMAVDWSTLYKIAPTTKKGLEPDKNITEAKDQAIITITPVVDKDGKTSYTVAIKVDTDTVLKSIDLLNFLASTNYYAEAISGSVTGGVSNVSVSGSIAMIFGFNDIQALIGDGCTIDVAGDFKLATTVGTNTRMIAGALSAGTSKIAVGTSIGSYVDEDTAVARIGTGTVGAKKTKVHAGGSVGVESTGDNDALVIVVAPAVGPDSTVSVGATIAVIYMDNAIDAAITDGCEITGDAGVAVVAQNTSKLLPITVSVADSGGVAVGGTLQIIIDKTATRAHVGDDVTIKTVNGPITVAALSSNEFIDVLASASVSSATKGSAAVAAVLNVIVSRSDTEATVGERSTLTAKGSYLDKGVVTPASVNVKAESEDFMVS